MQKQKKQQLPTPPTMTDSSKRPTSIADSLRFSYDFDNDHPLEYSEDGGKQIDFEFQELPQYQFRFDDNPMGRSSEITNSQVKNFNKPNSASSVNLSNKATTNQNAQNELNDSNIHRKIQIFQKYRQKQQEQRKSSQDNIVDSFDKIFNSSSNKGMFKKKYLNQQTNTPAATNTLNNQKAVIQTITTQQKPKPQTQAQQNLTANTSSTSIQITPRNVQDPAKKQTPKMNSIAALDGLILNKLTTPESQGVDPRSNTMNSINIQTSFDNSSDPFNMSQIEPNYKFFQNDNSLQSENLDNILVKQMTTSIKPILNPQTTQHTSKNYNNDPKFMDSLNPYSFNSQLKEQQIQIQGQRQAIYLQKHHSQAVPNTQNIKFNDVAASSNSNFILSNAPSANVGSLKTIPLQHSNSNQSKNVINFQSSQLPQGTSMKSSFMNALQPFTETALMKNVNQFANININISEAKSLQNLANPIFAEESRIPPFMRKIRKMNSIYPNFNHPTINLQNQAKFCNILASLFQQSFILLQKITLKALERVNRPKYFPTQFASLNYFLNSNWQKQRYKQWQTLNTYLRPRINFAHTNIDQVKIRSALSNYKQVIVYYKDRKIDLTSSEGIKTYFRIRQKFWSLEKNMRSISEDVYRMYQDTQYPNFYFQYLKVLRSALPAKNDQQLINHHQQILNTVLINRQKSEPLSCSEVGQAVKMKLQRQLKFLRPF